MQHNEMADWFAVAVAVSLPWSTSATSILIVLWLIVVVPSLSPASVRREVATAAGGVPVLLWGLAAIGMLWADASWSERFLGLRGFHKLLLIPLLLAHFRRSQRAKWVIRAFCVSAAVLLGPTRASPSRTTLRKAAALPAWLHRYNWHRPHVSLARKPPISRLSLTGDNLLRLHS